MKGASTTSYDEELTPEIDPPVIEPPPAATLLGRIFAHRRSRRTVVRAPLVRVDPPHTPAKPDEPAAEPAPEPPVDPANGPSADEFVAPVNVAEPEMSRDESAPITPPATPPARPPDVVADVATRYCPQCGDRVPVGVDGLHCHLGHALTGAHRKPKRRWFGLRR